MADDKRVEPPLTSSLLGRIAQTLRRRGRAWLRAIHRDAGYIVVGLTVIYAVSGLAINHIDDWNPNFEAGERTIQIATPLPSEESAAVSAVLAALAIDGQPSDHYRAGSELEIYFGEGRTIKADLSTGIVVESYERPRFFLRLANWLHYNRGKAAWTYLADGYAVILLFLAVSGIFMIKGRKGLIGRGGILILLGASVPLLYVHFSGGP